MPCTAPTPALVTWTPWCAPVPRSHLASARRSVTIGVSLLVRLTAFMNPTMSSEAFAATFISPMTPVASVANAYLPGTALTIGISAPSVFVQSLSRGT